MTDIYCKFQFNFIRLGLILAIAIMVGCTSAPKISPLPPVSTLPKVTQYALTLQGKPYRWGKESPDEGFDCSGFVQHVYARHGVSLPRTAKEMAYALTEIPRTDLRSGDLVFFNTSGKRYSHVGLYVKDDKFIHAPSRRSGGVHLSSLKQHYWRKRYTGARRPG